MPEVAKPVPLESTRFRGLTPGEAPVVEVSRTFLYLPKFLTLVPNLPMIPWLGI